MRASDVLKRALEMLRGGWTSAPLSLDAAGVMCPYDDESITLFCVHDALWLACDGDVFVQQDAEDLLNARLRLDGIAALIRDWASEWTYDGAAQQMRDARTHGEVLQLFTRAHAQALTKEQRA